jgi:diguanylate cyclase
LRNDRETALAKTALALMAECNVSPVPENFELFYRYAAGENPAVGYIIDSMISSRRPFTVSILQDLRERCFSRDRTERTVSAIEDSIATSLNDVLQKLDAASKQAFDYGAKLAAASDKLSDDRQPLELRRVVGGLISATKVMEDRTKSLEGELQHSSAQVSELKSQLDNVRKEALTDPLTGIANRKAFDANLQEAIEDARAKGTPLSLFMCDIDRFKSFNDTWGHQTGDQVLRLVATCLSENIKGYDTAARYGGEEFAVIVKHSRADDAVKLANRIRVTVEGKTLVKKSTGETLGSITISIGVAELTLGESAASLIQRADICLYRAKRAGRNLVIGENDPRAIDVEIDAA